ncbi:hypothetical protein, partial [Candidatus Neptunochlamydia vexilliferae]
YRQLANKCVLLRFIWKKNGIVHREELICIPDTPIRKYCSENKDQLKGNKDTINKIRRSIVASSLYK